MNKRSQITHITPLPSYVTRDAVLEVLHDHSLIITLNPLVTHHGRTATPEHALPDEHSSAWYEITDKIEYIPGTSLSGSVTYTACLHDLPNGLQTHIHAPAGLEIRGKWQLLGWLPGEERDAPEIGTEQYGIPKEGLYLREDCDLRCNFFLTPFVKKNMHKSHKALIKRLLKLAREQTAPSNTNGRKARSTNTEEVEVRVISDSPARPATGGGTSSPFNEQRQRAVLEWQSNGYSVSVSGGTQQNVSSSSAQQDQISRRGRSQSPGYAFVMPSLGPSKRYPSEGPFNRHNRNGSPASRLSTNSSDRGTSLVRTFSKRKLRESDTDTPTSRRGTPEVGDYTR